MSLVALRPPAQVMRLERLGAFHQTRLSFMRATLRYLSREHWTFERPLWRIDAKGRGVAVYCAVGPQRRYSLVCFAHDLDPALRSDRVIAEAWDATFALCEGSVDETTLERLSRHVPKQEAGRFRDSELVLSRANKSVRLFEHVVERLAAGRQPERALLGKVGYLLRTTAVYGNGKLGLADRDRLATRPETCGPFRAEMLAVWLIRAFSLDYVEQIAAHRNPEQAVTLEPETRRSLGIGNSTGLGMAPFLLHHPILLHRWITARETALARVRSLPSLSEQGALLFEKALRQACVALESWHSEDARQAAKIAALRTDLARLATRPPSSFARYALPWDSLFRWGERELCLEGQEMLVSLLLEPHAEIVDPLAEDMAAEEEEQFRIDDSIRLAQLRKALEQHYSWAFDKDYEVPLHAKYFWYISEEKLEPRLGERQREQGADLEQPLATARDAALLYRALGEENAESSLAQFLLDKPQHRHIVRRVQWTTRFPYAEIRDNLIGADLLPIDLLRCKLSFFGATRFDPRSDRWVRVAMYRHAPLPQDLAERRGEADDWAFRE